MIGVPIGLLTAIFMAKFCPKKLFKWLMPPINLLAGIPSIVYGFFGMVVVVPIIRNLFGGTGNSVLTVSIILGIMIAGNSTIIPHSLMDSVRTLTGNIVIEMSYAEGLHYDALIGTGVVLFVFILLLNLCFNLVTNRKDKG